MATRKIETELALSGEKEFNDAMKGVNSNLKNIRADMARVTAEFDGNADSIDALTAKEKILQSSVDQHRAKVDALQRMYDKQKDKWGENSDQADKFRLQLTQATTALIKEENALKKNTAAIAAKKAADIAAAEEAERLVREQKEAAEAAEQLAKDQKEAAGAAERLAREQKEAAEAAEAAAKKQERYAQKMERSEKRAEALKSGLEKLGGATAAVAKATAAGVAAITAAGGAALVGMINMAKESAEAAKAALEAGEELSASQQQWLAFSVRLDSLNHSATDAKSALASILLPSLRKLSMESGVLLDSFIRDMTAAAGDTEKQTEILGKYIADGAKFMLKNLPEYIKTGKELLAGIGNGFSEASPELLDMGEEFLVDFLNFVINKAPDLAAGGLEMVLQLIEGIDGEDLSDTASNLVGKLVSNLGAMAPKLIPAAAKLVSELLVGLVKNAPMLSESGLEMIWEILTGLDAALRELYKMGPVLIDALISGLRNSDSKVLQFGADVIEWIKDSITEAWDGLVSWFNGLWDSLFSGRDVDVNVNGNASGGNIDGSHADGLRYVPFDGYLAQLHRGEAVLPAAEADAYRSGQKPGTKVFNMNVYAQSLAKEEMEMLADYMDRKLGDDL